MAASNRDDDPLREFARRVRRETPDDDLFQARKAAVRSVTLLVSAVITPYASAGGSQ